MTTRAAAIIYFTALAAGGAQAQVQRLGLNDAFVPASSELDTRGAKPARDPNNDCVIAPGSVLPGKKRTMLPMRFIARADAWPSPWRGRYPT